MSLDFEKRLESANRKDLLELYQESKELCNEWIRRQVIQNNRIDILAYVLGLELQPFHIKLNQFQFLHPLSLQLAYRGSGKTQSCTVVKSIHLLLKDPNLRILLVSKTIGKSASFLKNIKGHFETNKWLQEIFGVYYDKNKMRKWGETEIDVLPKTSITTNCSVTCVGVEGQLVGGHFDVVIADDIVDESNARTKEMRDKTKAWYYNTLYPTLDPPDKDVPHRGEFHHLGTKYHYDDLYGHLIANECREHTQIIPALDEYGRSPWPERNPPSLFLELYKRLGMIIFNCQYQCNADAMKGELFEYEYCQQIEEADYPDAEDLKVWMGVDLAISEKDTADHFAIVVLGEDKSNNYYCLDFFEGNLRFGEQTRKILEYNEKWTPIKILIETNGYQAAQFQQVRKEHPDVPIRSKQQHKDKITRAMRLTPIFEDWRMFFKKNVHAKLIEHLVLFPSYKYKDLFDAFDLAVGASKLRKKNSRVKEPGLI